MIFALKKVSTSTLSSSSCLLHSFIIVVANCFPICATRNTDAHFSSPSFPCAKGFSIVLYRPRSGHESSPPSSYSRVHIIKTFPIITVTFLKHSVVFLEASWTFPVKDDKT